MKPEPVIVVDGRVLSVGEAMTVRVALSSFASSLREDGLGDDEHGRKMTSLYLESVASINAKMECFR